MAPESPAPAVNKLFVFVARTPELEPGRFWDRWGDELAELLASDPGRNVRRCAQNRGIVGATVPGLPAPVFDGAIEFWFDGPDGLHATLGDPEWRSGLDAAVARLGVGGEPLLLAAEESIQFDRGFGEVKFMAASRRTERFATSAEWVAYWREVHGPIAHALPEFTRYFGRYIHNYVQPNAHGTGGLEPPFDGVVEEWFESVDAFAHCVEEPAYLDVVRPDEQQFIGFSHVLITTEHDVPIG